MSDEWVATDKGCTHDSEWVVSVANNNGRGARVCEERSRDSGEGVHLKQRVLWSAVAAKGRLANLFSTSSIT